MMSLTVFAYGIKELTQFVLTENIFEKFKQKKMRATLKEHTLIFDFGRKPWHAAFRFLNQGHPFVVTEQNQDMIQAHEKIHFIAGDAH